MCKDKFALVYTREKEARDGSIQQAATVEDQDTDTKHVSIGAGVCSFWGLQTFKKFILVPYISVIPKVSGLGIIIHTVRKGHKGYILFSKTLFLMILDLFSNI